MSLEVGEDIICNNVFNSDCPSDQRGEETAAVPAPRAASPPASNNPIQAPAALVGAASPTHQEVGASDEFDPRSPISGIYL